MAEPVLAENIAAHLRRDILRGKFAPGATIKERDNAAELGVSRTPMREAIRMLAREGLLILRPSRSPVVANPCFKDVSDQVEVLLALEELAVSCACRNATDEDLAQIAALQDQFHAGYETEDPLDMFEVDMAFHSAIVEAAHNPALYATYRTYLERLWRARFVSASNRRNRDRAVGHHAKLVKALFARDESAARTAIMEHLGGLAEDIRPVIEDEHKA